MGFGWLRHLRAADFGARPRQCPRARRRLDHASRGDHRAGAAWEIRTSWRGGCISWLSQSPLILRAPTAPSTSASCAPSTARPPGSTRGARSRIGEARLSAPLRWPTSRSAPAHRRRRAPAGLAAPGRRDRRARSWPTAATSRAIRRCWSTCSPTCCPCARPMPARGSRRRAALLNAIDRMMPMLRLFRHDDGSLALFNGMSATSPDTLATLLAYNGRPRPARSRTRRIPATSACRRAASSLVVDAGPPPPQAYSAPRPCRLPVLRVLRRAASASS